MVDLKEECLLSAEEQQQSMINNNPSNSSTSQGSSEPLKSCTGCRTTTTPLWRGGPAGPKTLCNACGIKYHKKRRAMLGLESGKSDKAKSKKKIRSKITVTREDYNNGSDEEDKFAIKVPSIIKMVTKRYIGGRKMREEEQAAVLLMALSQGSLCA